MMELFDLIDIDGSGSLSLEEYRDVFFKIMRPPASKDMLRIVAMQARFEAKLDAFMGLPERKKQDNNGVLRSDAHNWKTDWEQIVAGKEVSQASTNGQQQQSLPHEVAECLRALQEDIKAMHGRFDAVNDSTSHVIARI